MTRRLVFFHRTVRRDFKKVVRPSWRLVPFQLQDLFDTTAPGLQSAVGPHHAALRPFWGQSQSRTSVPQPRQRCCCVIVLSPWRRRAADSVFGRRGREVQLRACGASEGRVRQGCGDWKNQRRASVRDASRYDIPRWHDIFLSKHVLILRDKLFMRHCLIFLHAFLRRDSLK